MLFVWCASLRARERKQKHLLRLGSRTIKSEVSQKVFLKGKGGMERKKDVLEGCVYVRELLAVKRWSVNNGVGGVRRGITEHLRWSVAVGASGPG